MKYLHQMGWILLFSFLGEACRCLLPWKLPASIYGLILLFGALALRLLRPAQLKEAGSLLVEWMPVLFVSPAVGLLSCWQAVAQALVPITVIILLSTVSIFAIAGKSTQWILHKKRERNV